MTASPERTKAEQMCLVRYDATLSDLGDEVVNTCALRLSVADRFLIREVSCLTGMSSFGIGRGVLL